MLSSTQRVWCFSIRSDSSCAYTDGFCDMNGPPKQAEKVACGSVTPTSVPASLEVKPVTKWYMTSSALRIETGGSTPNASAVSSTMVSGCGPRAPSATPGLQSSG